MLKNLRLNQKSRNPLKSKLLFLVFLSPLIAEAKQQHQVFRNKVEFIVSNPISKDDPLLGQVTIPGASTDITRMEDGKVIYKKHYSIGSNGFRTSAASNKSGKKKHFFIIDGSTSFGDGLSDDETIFHHLNEKSKTYESTVIGYLDYKFQHNWLQFKSGELPAKIKHKKGRAVLVSQVSKIQMFRVHQAELPVILDFPHIAENVNGELEYKGSIRNSTGLVNKLLGSLCIPIAACRRFLNHTIYLSDADYQAVGKLYNDFDKMYREQFEVEDFKIAWSGDKFHIPFMQKYTKVPIIHMPEFTHYTDGHPNPEGAKTLADFLFVNELKE